jgi:hypothetical protein
VMSFNQWLSNVPLHEDTMSDLIWDLCCAGRQLPPIHNCDDLLAYLRERHACRGALAAAPLLWLRFQSHVIWGTR